MKAGTLLLPFALSFFLLFGCVLGGVPQKDYDALKASCASDREASAAALQSEQAKSEDAAQRLDACMGSNSALNSRIALKDSEITGLQADKAVLDAARQKTGQIAACGLALQYYNDAFGPGSIANTYRLNRIDAQVASLSDQNLTALWGAVRNCDGITGCANARAAFVSAIQGKEGALAVQAAAIVQANSTPGG